MASGISFYGDQGDTDLTESSPAGSGFLSELTQEWEAAGSRAEDLGIRVVLLRLGVVLSGAGGALEKMRRPFRMGLGGPLGSGAQWFPWIHIDDVVGVIQWALQTPSARGAYNLVAPEQVQQRDFARSLGRAMGRPAVLPAPEFALRLTFGELADEAMLASHRARPFRLKSADFPFQWPELAPALEDVVRGGSTAPA